MPHVAVKRVAPVVIPQSLVLPAQGFVPLTHSLIAIPQGVVPFFQAALATFFPVHKAQRLVHLFEHLLGGDGELPVPEVVGEHMGLLPHDLGIPLPHLPVGDPQPLLLPLVPVLQRAVADRVAVHPLPAGLFPLGLGALGRIEEVQAELADIEPGPKGGFAIGVPVFPGPGPIGLPLVPNAEGHKGEGGFLPNGLQQLCDLGHIVVPEVQHPVGL